MAGFNRNQLEEAAADLLDSIAKDAFKALMETTISKTSEVETKIKPLFIKAFTDRNKSIADIIDKRIIEYLT